MSSDAAEIRAAARTVSGLAVRARAAGTAVTGAGHARWESVGAARFREKLAQRKADFQRCARELEELSRQLISLAAHVEAHEAAVLQALMAIEKGVGDAKDYGVDLSVEVKDAAYGTGAAAARAGKAGVDMMNPLTSLRHLG